MSVTDALLTPQGRRELRRVLTVPIAKQAAAVPAPRPVTAGVSWDAVRTTDLTSLARRVVNEDLGPGVPIPPIHPEKTAPRLYDYTPGINITITPRTYEDIQFAALRGLARSWDIASLCIQRNIDDLRQLHWEVRPKAVPGMDRDAVKSRKQRLEGVRAETEGFWMTPDQKHGWSFWLHSWAQEMYETDAATLYLERALDGSLRRVRVIDGTTIAPLVDELGEPPDAPEPAYRQIIRGLPWTFYMNDEPFNVVDQAGLQKVYRWDAAQPPDQRRLNFDTMHMVYEPFWGRPDSPYGHPPMEWVLLTCQRAITRQVLDYRLMSEGTTAHDFWKMPEAWTGEQIAELQAAFDKLLKMPTERARMRFMPGGPNTGLEHGFIEPETAVEEFLLHVGCAAYNRSPMEMGFIRSAGGAGLGGKSVAEEQGASAFKSVRALAFHLKGIIDRIIGLHFSAELEFVFPELARVQDALQLAQAEDIRIKNGSYGIDEARVNDHDLDPIGPAGHPSNMVYLGTAPPVQVVALLSSEPPEPTPGGANPPIPSAVPGQATNLASSVVAKALGGKHVEYTGDLAQVVHRYLLRSYPPADVAWVLDPRITWEYEPTVKLSDINLARRPGGRDPDKVEEIAGTVSDGASMEPLILLDPETPTSTGKLAVADGWHRGGGALKAGEDAVPAFVGRHVPDEYHAMWMERMQADSQKPDEDLRKWERKAVRSLKLGKSAAVPFESEAVSPAMQQAITTALAAAQTPADVRAMFEVLSNG